VTAIWLIAINFVRQQRVVTYIFLTWVVGFGLVFGFWGGGDRSDMLALFHQQAAYGVIYTLFLAAASVHGERQSRRILLVLAKGIHRREYIAGLLLGSVLMTCLYMGSLGLVNMWLASRLGLPARLWPILAAATLAAVLIASIATMFSTFAHPLLATIGTIILAGLPAGMEAWKGNPVGMFSPAAHVLQQIFHSDFVNGWTGGWDFVPMAVAQIVFFWALAGIIFQRKDVTAAIE
jgi:ABC-type transport system involved in multi-copper enzyme maturation permease subunit